jgi:hypothetical protein
MTCPDWSAEYPCSLCSIPIRPRKTTKSIIMWVNEPSSKRENILRDTMNVSIVTNDLNRIDIIQSKVRSYGFQVVYICCRLPSDYIRQTIGILVVIFEFTDWEQHWGIMVTSYNTSHNPTFQAYPTGQWNLCNNEKSWFSCSMPLNDHQIEGLMKAQKQGCRLGCWL